MYFHFLVSLWIKCLFQYINPNIGYRRSESSSSGIVKFHITWYIPSFHLMLHFYEFYTLDTMTQHFRLNRMKPFDGTNYSTRKFWISALLKENNVFEITTEDPPPVKDHDAHWLKKKNSCKISHHSESGR